MKARIASIGAVFALVAAGLVGASTTHAVESTPDVIYGGHVQSIGWQADVEDGAVAGTTGRALRLEALRITDAGYLPPLRVQAHVQNIGWQAAKTTPGTVGTTGKALRMEALRVSMPNAPAGVHVEYRAHVANIGWQPWVRDGATAGTTGRALRMEAVQIRIIHPAINPTSTPTPTVTVEPKPSTKAAFTADNGINSYAAAVFAGIGKSGSDASFILGDLGYENTADVETRFCKQVNDRVPNGATFLSGNHEDEQGTDGQWKDYANCLPDEVASSGLYGDQYVVDRDTIRFIMISPELVLNGKIRTYKNGTADQAWLATQIRDAKAEGRWVVVGMHKPCLTLGEHKCSSSPDLTNTLLREKADIVFSGHDHNYSRSHQLAGSIGLAGAVANLNAVDSDSAFTVGRGTVFVTVGNGGHNARTVTSRTVSGKALYAASSGTNSTGGITMGFGSLVATDTGITYSFTRTGGNGTTAALRDGFTIRKP